MCALPGRYPSCSHPRPQDGLVVGGIFALKRAHPAFRMIETQWPRMMADFQDAGPWANAIASYMKAP
jgi:hypothetical protein